MSLREVGWLIFLVGLPFAHLLFKPLDPWHGQAVWAQGWITVLFALSLGLGGRVKGNRPLGALVAWIGFITLSVWVKTILVQKVYPVPMLQGVMHLVLLLFAYYAAVTVWNGPFLIKLTRWMAYAGVVILGYCVLQLLNLDQFFKPIDVTSTDVLVGTIGNTTHLSTHLALLLPLFLLQPKRIWWLWSGITIALITYSGSLGGQVAALGVLVWWAWHKSKHIFFGVCALGTLGVLWVVFHSALLNPHGRLMAWGRFYEMFARQPITGIGPGYVMEASRLITNGSAPMFGWRHVHNEYFQMAIEYGIIGLGLVGWMMWEIVCLVKRLPRSPLVVALSAVLIAFGLNSLVNFPSHLWVLGSYALMAYCGLQVLGEPV